MSVLIDATTRFIVQGATGKLGRFTLADMKAYGTRVVAGVAASSAEDAVDGVPLTRTVAQAREAYDAQASIVFVPAVTALDHLLEAIDAGIGLVVYPGDGLPVRDAIELRAAARERGVRLLGPNTTGLISPGKAKAGLMPSFAYREGRLGVISRSGSLSYEVCHRLSGAGIGQSTVIGIGGDPIKGLTAGEALELFAADPDTDAILYLGEIGGRDEYDVARYARGPGAKPVAALVVGSAAPPGKKMGHAAALIGSADQGHAAKVDALLAAGVAATGRLSEVVEVARRVTGGAEPTSKGAAR